MIGVLYIQKEIASKVQLNVSSIHCSFVNCTCLSNLRCMVRNKYKLFFLSSTFRRKEIPFLLIFLIFFNCLLFQLDINTHCQIMLNSLLDTYIYFLKPSKNEVFTDRGFQNGRQKHPFICVFFSINHNKYISLPNNKKTSIFVSVSMNLTINCHINLKSSYIHLYNPTIQYHNHIYIHIYYNYQAMQENITGGLNNCFMLLSLCSYALWQFVMASDLRKT